MKKILTLALALVASTTMLSAQEKGGEVGNPITTQIEKIEFDPANNPEYVSSFCNSNAMKSSFYSIYMQKTNRSKSSTAQEEKLTSYFKSVDKDISKHFEKSCNAPAGSSFAREHRIFQACIQSCQDRAKEFSTKSLLKDNAGELSSECTSTCNQMNSVQNAYLNGFLDKQKMNFQEKYSECNKDSVVDLSRKSKDIIEKIPAYKEENNKGVQSR